jgi:hypothetical protein
VAMSFTPGMMTAITNKMPANAFIFSWFSLK